MLHESNTRRRSIKNEEGRALIDVPLTLGVVGVIWRKPLETEGKFKVEIQDQPSRPALSRRTVAAVQDLPPLMQRAFGEIVRCLGELGEQPAAMPFAACYNGDMQAVSASIPESHRDLVNGPRVAALTTLMPDGRPQTTVVWCNFDGRHVLVNTMRGFQKEKNMRRDPRVTLLAYDPRRPLRSLEIRGRVVEMTEAGALEHLDQLSLLYTGRAPYFGQCVPAELKARETPVLCRILPRRVVVLDAERKEAGSP